jgi:hypothetical protein
VNIFFAQSPNFDKFNHLLKENKNQEVLALIQSFKNKPISKFEVAQLTFYTAEALCQENKEEQALPLYLAAKKQYLAIEKKDLAMDIDLDIAYLLSCFHNSKNLHQFYINEYLDYAKTEKNDAKLLKGYVSIASFKINKKEAQESLLYFQKAIKLNQKVKDNTLASEIYNNISVLFIEILKMPDSSLYYLKKNEAIVIAKKDKQGLCYNLQNQADVYSHLKQYKKAIDLLNRANEMKNLKYDLGNKANINEFLYINNKEFGNFKEALSHLEISNQFHDSINEAAQEIAVNEIDTKYKTKEKELENLKLKTMVQNNKIIIYSTISLLFIIIVIGVLYYKNFCEKEKIAAQEKQIETQNYEKKLKDQELLGIDIMLENQEKERQNIANEIHDDLGSMLATLKLNFQNLKRQKDEINNQENKLYEKTDMLIEEAYQKIRTISHLKNLGVIGTEGLLVAVNQMAEKMSVLGKINFQVFPFGLDQRLENTLEVFIFRMIQELCTNTIKHADATEVNIYLTQHGNNEINIIIEDNGNGFELNSIINSEGIGLKSIEKKVEQLGGTFTVDSILTKGTTIVIDLPI